MSIHEHLPYLHEIKSFEKRSNRKTVKRMAGSPVIELVPFISFYDWAWVGFYSEECWEILSHLRIKNKKLTNFSKTVACSTWFYHVLPRMQKLARHHDRMIIIFWVANPTRRHPGLGGWGRSKSDFGSNFGEKNPTWAMKKGHKWMVV